MEFGDESVGVAFGRSKFSVSAKKYICPLFLAKPDSLTTLPGQSSVESLMPDCILGSLG
jgi:hypothetical protein